MVNVRPLSGALLHLDRVGWLLVRLYREVNVLLNLLGQEYEE